MKHKDRIIQLHKEGKSYTQIANELGCSKGTIAYHVGTGQKDKTLQRRRDRRNKIRKYIQEFKQSKGCMDCKEDYPYYVLEFDHREGEEKLFNISRATGIVNLSEVIKEIDKCDVVCSNCHKVRTWKRSTLDKGSGDVLDLQQQYLES